MIARQKSSAVEIRAEIDGPSMAETLVGQHFLLACDDCGFAFRCDASSCRVGESVVCPNCGFRKTTITKDALRPADQVTIRSLTAKQTSADDPIPRWSVVALRMPSDQSTWGVKRIVGLPGETISIRGGDLFANGSLLRKPFDQFLRLAILVHDDQHRPTKQSSSLPPRWFAREENSRWRTTVAGYQLATEETLSNASGKGAAATARFDWDWLSYRHWRCFDSPLPRTRESPILDSDPFNPKESRELNEVSDLMVSVRVQSPASSSADAIIALKLTCGGEDFCAEFFCHRVQLRRGNDRSPIQQLDFEPTWIDRERLLQLAVYDQQAIVAIDGRIVLQATYEPSIRTSPSNQADPMVALGGAATPLAIRELQVWRDINYLAPTNDSRPWTAERKLDPEEYFVLGDNPAVSVDSRTNPLGFMKRNAIVGVVEK